MSNRGDKELIRVETSRYGFEIIHMDPVRDPAVCGFSIIYPPFILSYVTVELITPAPFRDKSGSFLLVSISVRDPVLCVAMNNHPSGINPAHF